MDEEDDSSSRRSRLSISNLNKSEWEVFTDAFRGQCASQSVPCDAPLFCTRDECINAKEVEDPDVEEQESIKACNDMNSRAMGKLAVACRDCTEARAICSKYMPGSKVTSDDGVEFTRLKGDAHGAYIELETSALGGSGVDTAESTVSQLFGLDASTLTLPETLVMHETLVRRIKGLSAFTMDLLLKMHLLKLMSSFTEMAVVEEKCATDSTLDYNSTVSACRVTMHRKALTNESGEALARAGNC